jgi:hypothetical protein
VRGLSFPSHVILRPVFVMENLLAPYSLQGSPGLGARARLEATETGHAATRNQTDAEENQRNLRA